MNTPWILFFDVGAGPTPVAVIAGDAERASVIAQSLNKWVADTAAEAPAVPMPEPDDEKSTVRWNARKSVIDALVPPFAEADPVVAAAREAVLWGGGCFSAKAFVAIR